MIRLRGMVGASCQPERRLGDGQARRKLGLRKASVRGSVVRDYGSAFVCRSSVAGHGYKERLQAVQIKDQRYS